MVKSSLVELFRPDSYELTSKEDSWQVKITGKKIGAPSKRLTFHQKKLKVTAAKITYYGKRDQVEHEIARINHLPTFDEVRLHTKASLYPGNYIVAMTFIVKPPATAETAEAIKTAYESGQPTRQFFPCIDEPEAKEAIPLEVSYEGR